MFVRNKVDRKKSDQIKQASSKSLNRVNFIQKADDTNKEKKTNVYFHMTF